MAIFSVAPSLPNQDHGQGDDLALSIEQYTGVVEGTLERMSKLAPHINIRTVRGTSTLTNEGIGESTLQVLKKGEAPDPTINQNAQTSVTVDTTVIARNWVAQIDDFQKNYDYKAEIGREHGKKIAKFTDNAFGIMASKVGMMVTSAFNHPTAGELPGHKGGTQVQLANANDMRDPASLYAAITRLFAEMEEKDVDPQNDGVICAVRSDIYYALLQADQIVVRDYITAQGTQIFGAKILKALDVPIISTNNLPRNQVTNHELSNARNKMAFDGDFSKLVLTAFSPDALLAGETVPLSTDVWWDQKSKGYFIDAWLAFSAAAARAEKAGVIVTP